jgi:hypothetical protein
MKLALSGSRGVYWRPMFAAPKISGTATGSASEETGGFDGVAPTGTFTGRVWAPRALPNGRSSGIGSSGPAPGEPRNPRHSSSRM